MTGSCTAGSGALTGSGSTLTFVEVVAGNGTELASVVAVGAVVEATEIGEGSALAAAD